MIFTELHAIVQRTKRVVDVQSSRPVKLLKLLALASFIVAISIPNLSTLSAQADESIFVHVNLIVIDDGKTGLADDAFFDDDSVAVGQMNEEILERVHQDLIPGVNQILAQCNIATGIERAFVVKPELLESPFYEDSTMLDIFDQEESSLMLDFGSYPSPLSELTFFTLHQLGDSGSLDLYRSGPFLNLFVTGAQMATSDFWIPSAAQFKGRHSIIRLRSTDDLVDPGIIEALTYSWARNIGLYHTDEDGYMETDDDLENLMRPGKDRTGSAILADVQCEEMRGSAIIAPRPSNIEGTINVPKDFDTIQEAIGAAAPGATVEISEGEYWESLQVDKPLTLRAAPGDDVSIYKEELDGSPLLLIDNASGIRVEGFVFHGEVVLAKNCLDVTLYQNHMSDSNSYGIYLRNARVNVEGNFVYGSQGHAISVWRNIGSTFLDNTVYDNQQVFGSGIIITGSTNIKINHNSFHDNLEGIVLMMSNENIEIIGNSIMNNLDYGLSLYPFEDSVFVIGECHSNQISGNRVDISENIPTECIETPASGR